ncbi:uncharacterized protein LOC102718310 [Oryza brachyantha]|uniref:Uncharacterized protein n=1 Tax=Oryza brachyantha TaxID=4533 RepID=J3L0J2_ORYBR|nr:uncharacterized protein LOC102718310 [Oryza brachyantha]
MASRATMAALLLLALVAAEGHAVPLRRGLSLGWMTGMKGGPPTGTQPSSIHPAAPGEGGRRLSSEEEGEFIHTLPAFRRPPIPPSNH